MVSNSGVESGSAGKLLLISFLLPRLLLLFALCDGANIRSNRGGLGEGDALLGV